MLGGQSIEEMHMSTLPAPRIRPSRLVVTLVVLSLLVVSLPATAGASGGGGYLTSSDPLVALEPSVPSGGRVIPIIDSGDALGSFVFEGLPDGIGLTDGRRKHTVDVYVTHEQSRVPFNNAADHQDSSISKLTLSTSSSNRGAVKLAEVALGPEEGFIRFCSAFMATKKDGFRHPTFFTGEESNDVLAVPAGALYGPDPSLAPNREAGYAVAYDTKTGEATHIPGMGRLNHENTVAVDGKWRGVAMLTTDDTFTAPSSQLYLYRARSGNAVLADRGTLYAFRVTATDAGPVDPTNAQNGANDYLDIQPGVSWKGEFIEVPEDIAKGTTAERPQVALENWSNANNVFQFIRLEDIATDKRHPTTVYIADTGTTRVVPDSATGRMMRGPDGTVGLADNGRIFKFVFDSRNPLKVKSFSVLAQGDNPAGDAFVAFRNPDNLDTSKKSLMVQEDTPNAKVWQLRLKTGQWGVVAHVTDPVGESSGIVDASRYFGSGWWLLDVQAHGSNQMSEVVGGVTIKREDGQLLLMKIPGS
jgi:hypothetical protein